MELKVAKISTVYNSLIYPYLYYGNNVWANNSPSRLNEIYEMQKKALLIINFSSYNEHSALKIKLLNLYQINDLVISIFMFDFQEGNLPNYILFIYLFTYLFIYLFIYLFCYLKIWVYTACTCIHKQYIRSVNKNRKTVNKKKRNWFME